MATTSNPAPTLGSPTAATATATPKIELGSTLQAVFHGILPAGVTSIDPSKASQYVQQLAQSNPSEFLVLQRMLMNSGALDTSNPLGNTPQSTTATATAFQQLIQSTQNGQGGLTASGKSQNASQVLQDYGGSQGQTVTNGTGEASGSNTPKPVDVQGKDVSYTPENANTIEQTVGDDLQSMSGIGLTPQQAQQAVSERQGSQAADAQAEEDQDNQADQAQYTQAVAQQQAQLQNNTNLIVKNSVPNPNIKNPGQYAQAVLGYLGEQNDPGAVSALTAYITSAGHWGNGSKNPLNLKLAVGNSSHNSKDYSASYTSWAQSIVATASIIAKDPTIVDSLKSGDDENAVVGLNNATGNRVSKNGFAQHKTVAQGFVNHMTTQQKNKFNRMAQGLSAAGGGAAQSNPQQQGPANQAPNTFNTTTKPGQGIEGAIPKNAGGTRAKQSLLDSASKFAGKNQNAQQANPYQGGGQGWMGGTAVKNQNGHAGTNQQVKQSADQAVQQQQQQANQRQGATGPGQPGSMAFGIKGFMGQQQANTPTQGTLNSDNNHSSNQGPAMSGQDVISGTPANLGNAFTPGKVTNLPAQISDEDIARQIALGPDRQQTLGNDYLESYLKLMDWMNTTADTMESRFGAGSHG